MNTGKRTLLLLTLALLVTGYCTTLPLANAADQPPSDISDLFSQIKTEAHQLESDADDLHMFVRSSLSWESHSAKLDMMREHINKAGQLLTELNDARGSASPWQQKAIDEIHPVLRELADNMEATINHLRDNKGRIHVGNTFKDYAASNYDLSKELAALVADYVDYGKHEAEFQRLQDKLQVPEG